ncbi:hypothetical protein [Paenibacillus amylolyticus]|uniref:hypothetical protein n=1 Tax=Paenibacillus amylolyticus TaxID=1451 RepID=UPI003EB83DC5
MKAQTKKFAYFSLENRQVHVSEALRLRNQGKIEINKDNPVFFDYENSGMLPVSSSPGDQKVARESHFRYFNNENKKQILYSKNMTNAHLLYQMMFLQLNKFIIKDENKREVQVTIKSAQIEHYIKVDNKSGIFIDVFLDIDYTDPHSYKYLWNSKLAIEVKVSHAVEPKKRNILQNQNIATFEASIPKAIQDEIPETNEFFENEQKRQNKIDHLKKRYENYNKFILLGKFIAKSKPEYENKESYILLSQFETEIAKYQKKKDELNVEIKKLEEDKIQSAKRNDELKRTAIHLEEDISNNQALLLDYKINKQLVRKLKVESEQKKQEIHDLKTENNSLKNSIDKIKNETFWGTLKRKLLNK